MYDNHVFSTCAGPIGAGVSLTAGEDSQLCASTSSLVDGSACSSSALSSTSVIGSAAETSTSPACFMRHLECWCGPIRACGSHGRSELCKRQNLRVSTV